MIIGLGIDIVANKRIKIKKTFIDKILSLEEKKIFNSFLNKKRQREFLAGRWAAKEAFIKANQDQNISLLKISIVNNNSSNKLIIKINNKECSYIYVSISHEKKYTVGIVIIDK